MALMKLQAKLKFCLQISIGKCHQVKQALENRSTSSDGCVSY